MRLGCLIPPCSYVRLEDISTDELASYMGKLAEACGYDGRNVVICVPLQGSKSGLFRLPPLPRREVKEAIRWFVRKERPYGGFACDYVLLGSSRTRRSPVEAIVSMVPEAPLAKITRACQAAGLRSLGIIETAVALWALVAGSDVLSAIERLALVDLSGVTTTLCFFRHGVLILAREVAGPLRSFKRAPGSVDIGTGGEGPELRPGSFGMDRPLLGPDEWLSLKAGSSLFEEALDRLVGEIKRSMESFLDRAGGGSLGSMFITGDLAGWESPYRLLSKELGVKVRPLRHIECIEEPPESPQGYTGGASGLLASSAAIMGLMTGWKRRSLPVPYRRGSASRFTEGRGFPAFTIISLLLLVVALAAGRWISMEREKVEETLSAARWRRSVLVDTRRSWAGEIESLRKELELKEAFIRFMKAKSAAPAYLMKEISRLTPSSISLERMVVTPPGYREVFRSDKNEKGPGVELSGRVPEGAGYGGASLMNYMMALERSSFFGHPVISKRRLVEDDSGEALEFSVKLDIK